MNSKKNIELLLNKFLSGELTVEGKHQLYELLGSSENENLFRETIFHQLNEFNEDQVHGDYAIDFDGILGNILNEINQNDLSEAERIRLNRKSRIKRIIISGLSIAAVFIIAFFLGTIFSGSANDNAAKQVIAVSYNVIKAPYGSQSEIILPDSTQVILNAGSTIRYRSDFNSNNRDIVLVGEAYFKVAKNIEIPLNVNAGKINVKATGTEFNIKAYDDESIIETTLVDGKVEISQLGLIEDANRFINLNPNQKAIYIKETETFTLEKIKSLDSLATEPVRTIYDNILISPRVDVNQVVAWTQGKLIIRGENLENLCVELQRKYDVKIIFRDDEIKQYRFTGVLLDETLEQVLNVIKLTAPIDYLLEGKTVFMSTDKVSINKFSKHLK